MASPKQYKRGQTVVITAEITDKDNDAATPSVSIVIRIMPEATDTLVALSGSATEDDMSSDGSTGKYKYEYTLAADAPKGKWLAETIATDGDDSLVSMGSAEFEVILRLGESE